ncbi:hypothetical protein [Parahaliea mediterranea]|uniref:hypothetical protein n=1 Tax=Parahaliea mediterranea TaxID=651086 RepID=UPI000E2F5827|nr:hypothetical protein [Parahaliea mediterranea]
MNLYLEPDLATQRHGRFFISQLDAEPTDELPACGTVLMHGKHFQAFNASDRETWWQWTGRPGCTLLLLPPFEPGELFDRLDWQITLRDETPSSDDGIIPDTLSSEVTMNLAGSDGEFDRMEGHQWTDYSVNTRYIKQHHGTGVFAATCLPLWSISLLDHAEETLVWLEKLSARAGTTAESDSSQLPAPELELEPTDYTLMVCMQAWDINTATDLSLALSNSAASLFSIPEEGVLEGMARLRVLGLIDDEGLTNVGRGALNKSPYGSYVERLKEVAPL